MLQGMCDLQSNTKATWNVWQRLKAVQLAWQLAFQIIHNCVSARYKIGVYTTLVSNNTIVALPIEHTCGQGADATKHFVWLLERFQALFSFAHLTACMYIHTYTCLMHCFIWDVTGTHIIVMWCSLICIIPIVIHNINLHIDNTEPRM